MRTWRAWFGIGLLPLTLAACSTPVFTPRTLAGMETHRISEPVFNGHANVYEAGREHPRSIVLVHGIGDGPVDFAEHIGWLSRSYHVIAFDLPGFGQSDKTNALYSPGNYAAFVKYVAERFVRRPFVLLGHSMGGVIAMRYAALHPADVTRLVVVDTPGVLHRYVVASQALGRIGFDFLPSFMDPLERFAQIANKVLRRIETTTFDPHVVLNDPSKRDTYLGGDPSRIASMALAMEDLSRALPTLPMETLVIWGRNDTIAPVRTGRMLARVIPRARLVELERAAHVPMLETPAPFRAALEKFLVDGIVPVRSHTVPMRYGEIRCLERQHVVYEGDYDKLTLNDCRDVRIRGARVRELNLSNSTVMIDDSHIGGGAVGMHAHDTTVVMTNGRIEGDVAISGNDSRFDLAGVEIDARQHILQAQESSYVVFSASRVKSPNWTGVAHSYFLVTRDKPL
ncbi:MAG TPA: alpha/beta hydrolase [Burkholderiales bacterium]|nr:alpha/beta hydrolase [Burkholderiales bacterium]